jgi:RNA polymerase sigma factor (sigma-70 family)
MLVGRLSEAALPKGGGLSDGQLLGQFVARRDDAAFAALVHRHGPMVLAVCRRVLRHVQDAEDAFQAAFLVLARKAAVVADREAVAGWLHGVAYRAALGARASAVRRRARELQVEAMPHPVAPPEDDQRELLELLDRELARLPEKYRLPVVLCELEGRSRKEAARHLGLPEGTLSSRLATARRLLAARLCGRGAAVSAAALGAVFAEGARAACVPGRLLVSTVRVAGGPVPAGVAALTEGVMKSMLLTKLKATAWGLLLAASISVGAVALTYRPATAQPAPAAQPPAAAKAAPSRDELEALRLEVEALRLDLKATKERVQALEDKAQRAQADNATQVWLRSINQGDDSMRPWTESVLQADDGGRAWIQSVLQAPDARSRWNMQRFGLWQAPPPAAPTEDVKKLAAEVEAAAKKLREKPDDKQALEELNCAVERLRKAKQQKSDP